MADIDEVIHDAEQSALRKAAAESAQLRTDLDATRRDLFIAKKVICRLYNVVLGVRAHFAPVKFERSLSKYVESVRKEIITDMKVPELKANDDYYEERAK